MPDHPDCEAAGDARCREERRGDFDPLFRRLGRNDMPAALFDEWHAPDSELWQAVMLDGDSSRLRWLLEAAWTGAEWPGRYVEPEQWSEWFGEVGFFSDCLHVEAPTETVTLHRGCMVGHEHGMSWTDDLERARWFAGRPHHREPGVVLAMEVPPWMVHARFVHGRSEAEWVLWWDWWDSLEATVIERDIAPDSSC